MKIRINSIMEEQSLCDGMGCRTVLFLQGCDIHCPGCQNESTWNPEGGKEMEVSDLALELRRKAENKKITVSGGEPLLQKEPLLELLRELKDCDLCLYTGHKKEEVPEEILAYLKYLKTGPFVEALKTTMKPFVGSSNQIFMEVKNGTAA